MMSPGIAAYRLGVTSPRLTYRDPMWWGGRLSLTYSPELRHYLRVEGR